MARHLSKILSGCYSRKAPVVIKLRLPTKSVGAFVTGQPRCRELHGFGCGESIVWQTVLTVASASVLGSLHCVAMCGPLVALAHRGAPPDKRWSASASAALWHSSGRLLTYVSLGMAAGVVGKAVDIAGRVGSVQRRAAILSGLMLGIGWGIWTVLPVAQRRASTGGSHFAQRLVQLRGRKPSVQAAMMGVLAACVRGWLWAFVAMAAGRTSRGLEWRYRDGSVFGWARCLRWSGCFGLAVDYSRRCATNAPSSLRWYWLAWACSRW